MRVERGGALGRLNFEGLSFKVTALFRCFSPSLRGRVGERL